MSFPIRKIGMLEMPKIAMLSTTANELVKVASATQEAVNRIVQGPEEAPLTDFFRKLAGSELRRSDDQDKIQEDGQQ